MSTPSLPVPESELTDDHLLAHWLADVAGRELTAFRASGPEGTELKDGGDALSHDLIVALLGRERPDDVVLSEEGADDTRRLSSARVWIVDPLDGTREYSEPPRTDWAVHVALWSDGDLVAGAVAQPGLGETFSTAQPTEVPALRSQPMRIAVSRTRPPEFVSALAEETGADLMAMGSAGAKVISVVRDASDVYVHAGGQYEWDSAAPVAVARACGLHTSRADGSPLAYNRPDPYLPDLLVCRPEYADLVTGFVRRWWADHPA